MALLYMLDTLSNLLRLGLINIAESNSEVFVVLRVILSGFLCIYMHSGSFAKALLLLRDRDILIFRNSNRSLYFCPCTPQLLLVEWSCDAI